jgi:large subunit ribosomal protein L18
MRLSVHRSTKNLSVQLIDDVNGVTLRPRHSQKKHWASLVRTTSEAAVGRCYCRAVVARCQARFDRGDCFHGQVKAVADATRLV